MRVRAWVLSVVTAGMLLVSAPSALAHATQSTNWAGYAVHGSGVKFTHVQGTWREPSLTCQRGKETFSSYWVGIGGYSLRSRALEQVGTEVDCTSAGVPRAYAWYELVPAPSRPVGLPVPPGDMIRGTVTVRHNRVHVALHDLSSHRTLSRTLRASTLDVSSAEWIVEAPSDCVNTNTCVTLPLGDFGSASFKGAHARISSGHLGAIADRRWHTSAIDLTPAGRLSRLAGRTLGPSGAATASRLRAGGSAFTVSYVPLKGGAASLAPAVSASVLARPPSRGATLPGTLSVPSRQVEHPGPQLAGHAG
jgi:hypothetical protein